MLLPNQSLFNKLAQVDAVLITIDSFEGSSPREVGAWMLVLASEVLGTVGGGNLEYQAIAHGRDVLASHGRDVLASHGRDVLASHGRDVLASHGLDVLTQLSRDQVPVPANHTLAADKVAPLDELRRYPLGPALGQCCGGVVHLKFSFISAQDAIKRQAALSMIHWARGLNAFKVTLFGGGHVGKALVNVLSTLPCAITWVDSRDEIFPEGLPSQVQCEHSAPVHAAVHSLDAGSHVLIMSFSHAEDLDVVAACLMRLREKNDLPFIGLIGSKTKWATFRHRLQERGFSAKEIARITSPIGIDGIAGKEPEVIAVSVAAQLLLLRSQILHMQGMPS